LTGTGGKGRGREGKEASSENKLLAFIVEEEE